MPRKINQNNNVRNNNTRNSNKTHNNSHCSDASHGYSQQRVKLK